MTTILLTAAELIVALILFWHGADSPKRDARHRAMLYSFGFAAMCFGATRFLIGFGASRAEWIWMLDLGHVSLMIFAALWITREIDYKAKINRRAL